MFALFLSQKKNTDFFPFLEDVSFLILLTKTTKKNSLGNHSEYACYRHEKNFKNAYFGFVFDGVVCYNIVALMSVGSGNSKA